MELIVDVEPVPVAPPPRWRVIDCLIVGLLLWILADVQHDSEQWRFVHDFYTWMGVVMFAAGLVKSWRE